MYPACDELALVSAPCFVLGLFDTGLATVRAIGRAGLSVFGFDHDPAEFGFRSRFGAHETCPDPASAADLLAFLRQRAGRFSTRPVLYPTSDAYVAFVSEHREALASYSQYALPCRDSVAAGLNKSAQHARAVAAGVPTAHTHTVHTLDDVQRVAPVLDYPVIVKPLIGHLWRQTFRGEKAVPVEDADTLIALFRDIQAAGQSALVQSIVQGPNTNHVKVSAYFDALGGPRAVICMRKIRQYPVDFGVGTLMETVVEPEVQELGLRFFRAMAWRGPGSIEFKRDERDGEWKLIELNPRLWQQHGLAAACGMNFPLLQYLDLAGRPETYESYAVGVRWLDEFRDPRSAWEHRRRGLLTFTQWARSLARVRSWALWAADDPAPFLAAARHYAASAFRSAARASSRAG